MCGFVGFLNPKHSINFEETLKEMSNMIVHRGPDSSGQWCDEEYGFGVAHQRLSILDLSNLGSQPMLSHSRRYVMAFNGEIYNHLKLRKELEKKFLEPIKWMGNSDTETFIQCIEFMGLKKALKETIGMFSFALWDRKEKKLYLARDRVGEKPLYYGYINETVFFASELKALKPHPLFKPEIDQKALKSFLRFGYIKSPDSIYKNIKKLNPGTYKVIKLP